MLLMSRNDCLTGLCIKLGPALKIYHMHIHKLQKKTDFLGWGFSAEIGENDLDNLLEFSKCAMCINTTGKHEVFWMDFNQGKREEFENESLQRYEADSAGENFRFFCLGKLPRFQSRLRIPFAFYTLFYFL